MKQRPLLASSFIAFLFSLVLMLLLSCENSSPSGDSSSGSTASGEPSWMTAEDEVSIPLAVASPLNNDSCWAAYMQRADDGAYGEKILHTSDGGYVISGSSYQDLWIIRFSANDNIAWQKKFRLTEIGYTYADITEIPGGGFLSLIALLTPRLSVY